MTTSGGAGSLAADIFTEHGWDVPTLSRQTPRKLAEVVPEFGAVSNPLDFTAQLFSRTGRRFPDVCTAVLGDESVDALAVLVTMATGEAGRQLAEDVVRAPTSRCTSSGWRAGSSLPRAGGYCHAAIPAGR